MHEHRLRLWIRGDGSRVHEWLEGSWRHVAVSAPRNRLASNGVVGQWQGAAAKPAILPAVWREMLLAALG